MREMHHAWSNKGRSKKRQLCKKRKFNGNIGKIKKKLRKLGEFKTFVEIGLKYAICIIGRPLLSSRPSWLLLSTRPPAKGIRPTTPNIFSQNMMTRRLRDAQLRFKRTFCVISAELMRIQGGLSGYNRNGASVTSVAHYSCHVGCYGMTTCFFIEWRHDIPCRTNTFCQLYYFVN